MNSSIRVASQTRQVCMSRVSVIGTTGSGKTTFAAQLAQVLGVRHIELDALSWEPDWQTVSTDELRSRVATAIDGDGWVVDGNYSSVRGLVWDRIDAVVWLDYAWPLVMSRIIRRTIRRLVTRELCCNGNRENIRRVLSRDSIIVWALRTYRRHRRDYPALLNALEQKGVQPIRLRSPGAARRWLRSIADTALQHHLYSRSVV